MARSRVYVLLARAGLSRLDRVEPRAPVVRYERQKPGELVHLATNMRGRIGHGRGHRVTADRSRRHRGIVWSRVHVAVDDFSWIAYAEELPDDSPDTTAAFPRQAARFYADQGHHARADPHRQRRLLSQPGLRRRLRGPRAAPPLDPAVSAPDQRQGRADGLDAPRRMGLCRRLCRHRQSDGPPSARSGLPQPLPATLVTGRAAADQPGACQQPAGAEHLAVDAFPLALGGSNRGVDRPRPEALCGEAVWVRTEYEVPMGRLREGVNGTRRQRSSLVRVEPGPFPRCNICYGR